MDISVKFPVSPVPKESIRTFASVLLFFLFLASSAYAHKVSVFAWVEGDTVFTEGYFGGKKKAMGGLIRVFDPEGRQLIEGKSDEDGAFSFKIPQKTDLRIVLEATMGHKAEFILKAEDLSDTPVDSQVPLEKQQTTPAPSPAVQTDTEQIRLMMEEVLDARLKPIARGLAKIQQKRGPGLTEIFGGIGYIFGLMGVALYFISRKKDRTQ